MLLKCFLVSHVKNSSHQINKKYLFLLLSTLCKKIENSSTSISLLLLHARSYWSMYIWFYWVGRNVWRGSQINRMFSCSSWEVEPTLHSQAPWAVLLWKKVLFNQENLLMSWSLWLLCARQGWGTWNRPKSPEAYKGAEFERDRAVVT